MVTVDGTPNLAIQPLTKALAMVSAVIFDRDDFWPTSETMDACQ